MPFAQNKFANGCTGLFQLHRSALIGLSGGVVQYPCDAVEERLTLRSFPSAYLVVRWKSPCSAGNPWNARSSRVFSPLYLLQSTPITLCDNVIAALSSVSPIFENTISTQALARTRNPLCRTASRNRTELY